MKNEMFSIAGKCIEKVWLHPPESSLVRRGHENLLTIPATIYNKWSLVVRADDELHGLAFWAGESMICSGMNPLYEKMLYCKKLDREECLNIIVWASQGKDLTVREEEEWKAICEKRHQEAEEREQKRDLEEKKRRYRQYEKLKGEFGQKTAL